MWLNTCPWSNKGNPELISMGRFNPPAPALTGPIVALTIQSLTANQVYETIHHYMAANPVTLTPSILQALITSFTGFMNVNYQSCVTAQTSLTTVFCADLSPGTTPTQQSALGPLAGTATGAPLPGTVAVCITKRTHLKGQHGRGRLFMPAIPNSFYTPATDPNVVNAAGLAAYSSLIGGMVSFLTGGGQNWTPVVLTRPTPPLVNPANAAPVTDFTTDPIFATVRRRREGRGI